MATVPQHPFMQGLSGGISAGQRYEALQSSGNTDAINARATAYKQQSLENEDSLNQRYNELNQAGYITGNSFDKAKFAADLENNDPNAVQLASRFANEANPNKDFTFNSLSEAPPSEDGVKRFTVGGEWAKENPVQKGMRFLTGKGSARDEDPVEFGTAEEIAQQVSTRFNVMRNRPGVAGKTRNISAMNKIVDSQDRVEQATGRLQANVEEVIGLIDDPELLREVQLGLGRITDPQERLDALRTWASELSNTPDEMVPPDAKEALAQTTQEALTEISSAQQAPAGKEEDRVPKGRMKRNRDAIDATDTTPEPAVFGTIETIEANASTAEDAEQQTKKAIREEDVSEVQNWLKENNITKLEDVVKLERKTQQALRAYLSQYAVTDAQKNDFQKKWSNVVETGQQGLNTKDVADLSLNQQQLAINQNNYILNLGRERRLAAAAQVGAGLQVDAAREKVFKDTIELGESVQNAMFTNTGKDAEGAPEFEWNEESVKALSGPNGGLTKMMNKLDAAYRMQANGKASKATKARIEEYEAALNASISSLLQGAGMSEDYGGFLANFWPDKDGGSPEGADATYSRIKVIRDGKGNIVAFRALDPSSQGVVDEKVPAATFKRILGARAYEFFEKQVVGAESRAMDTDRPAT